MKNMGNAKELQRLAEAYNLTHERLCELLGLVPGEEERLSYWSVQAWEDGHRFGADRDTIALGAGTWGGLHGAGALHQLAQQIYGRHRVNEAYEQESILQDFKPLRETSEWYKKIKKHNYNGSTLYTLYAKDGKALAQKLRKAMGVRDDELIDVIKAADFLGVNLAGVGAWYDEVNKTPAEYYSVTYRVEGKTLAVINTALNDFVQTIAIAHTLGHAAAGDYVGGGHAHYIEDQDDDSLYHCGGTSSETCWRADRFASHLLLPKQWMKNKLGKSFNGALTHNSPAVRGPHHQGQYGTSHQLPGALWDIRHNALEAQVPPHYLAHEAGRRLHENWMYLLEAVFRIRSPYGYSSRNDGKDAVCHNDLAMGVGTGAREGFGHLEGKLDG